MTGDQLNSETTTSKTSEKLRSLSIDRSTDAGAQNPSINRNQIVLGGVAVAVILGILWLVFGRSTDRVVAVASEPSAASTTPAPSATTTPSAPVTAGRLIASGYVTARRQATVSSEITGRIKEILVEEGAFVEEGQVLANLDSTRAEIALDLATAQADSARAAVNATRAELVEARNVLRRTNQIRESGFTTEAAVTAAQARVDSLEAQLTRASADLQSSEIGAIDQKDLVERHSIRAPFAGVIVGKNAQAGEIVSPTSAGGGFTRTGIYTIVDMTSLEIEVDVNEGSIDQVFAGQTVEAILDAYPGWRIPASVIAIIPTADRSRATITVRVGFDELDPRILPDMAAKVTFIAAEQ